MSLTFSFQVLRASRQEVLDSFQSLPDGVQVGVA